MEYRLLLSKKNFEEMCMCAAECEDVKIAKDALSNGDRFFMAIAVAGALDHLRKEIFKLGDETEV